MTAKTAKPAAAPKAAGDYLSLGVTLLNLATYGRTDGGLKKGHIYRLIGRSATGKTWVGRTILAEAAINPAFKDYKLVYADEEGGALMDTRRYFGSKLADRLTTERSESQIDFYRSIHGLLDKGEKVIWIEDSLDSLVPDAQSKMMDGKAKVNSQELRKLLNPLEKTGSILILVSQTRMNIGSMFGGDIASGGMAPEFYSTLEIWLRKAKGLKKNYKGRDYPIGILISARVKKNRISGIDRTVQFPLYYASGIDDLGACINYLVASKHWQRSKGIIVAPEFAFEGKAEKLIDKIQTDNLQRELQVLTGKVWHEIERACTINRKSKYE